MTLSADQLRASLRSLGPSSASALARHLGLSTPTVTAALARMGSEILPIARGRASRYALTREVGRAGRHWPLFRINPDGQPQFLGELHALQGGWYLQAAQPLPLFMHGEFAQGLYPDLPWFLQTLRPQGYLGREFVQRFAAELDAPNDITRWQADDILLALLRYGDALPGELVLGDKAMEAAMFAKEGIDTTWFTAEQRQTHYPRLAAIAETNGAPGSSAAGEQPKFTATLEHSEHGLEPVIVKFARLDADNATARRWANLLICEQIASQVLNQHNFPSAQTEIVDADGWRFLQSSRFDRTPQGGRIGVAPLDALDAAYVGAGEMPWMRAVTPLHAQGLIGDEDLACIRLLQAFGDLIGNRDMHFGNLGFFTNLNSRVVRLAPVYDMLPMHYRPGAGGSIRDEAFALPAPDLRNVQTWSQASDMAQLFWQRAGNDQRIDDNFRALCVGNAQRLGDWRKRYGV
jgi:serine/threonine protein kinase HipA of HipAB toxin-antitoxin module